MLTENQLPLSIVKLLIGFFVENISEEESERLDEWICENENNMKIFGECMEVTIRK